LPLLESFHGKLASTTQKTLWVPNCSPSPRVSPLRHDPISHRIDHAIFALKNCFNRYYLGSVAFQVNFKGYDH
jgi:hypothetical protein